MKASSLSSTAQVVEFAEGMGPKEVLFWRIFFEHLLLSAKSRQEVAGLFQKIAGQVSIPQPVAFLLALFLSGGAFQSAWVHGLLPNSTLSALASQLWRDLPG